jgi:hypothetical protein
MHHDPQQAENPAGNPDFFLKHFPPYPSTYFFTSLYLAWLRIKMVKKMILLFQWFKLDKLTPH